MSLVEKARLHAAKLNGRQAVSNSSLNTTPERKSLLDEARERAAKNATLTTTTQPERKSLTDYARERTAKNATMTTPQPIQTTMKKVITEEREKTPRKPVVQEEEEDEEITSEEEEEEEEIVVVSKGKTTNRARSSSPPLKKTTTTKQKEKTKPVAAASSSVDESNNSKNVRLNHEPLILPTSYERISTTVPLQISDKAQDKGELQVFNDFTDKLRSTLQDKYSDNLPYQQLLEYYEEMRNSNKRLTYLSGVLFGFLFTAILF